MQHYPRREVSKDGVVIQDIADELEQREYGLCIVIMALREIRNEYREGNPWVPQTGYILKQIGECQKRYADHYKRLTTPPRATIENKTKEAKEKPKKWPDMTESEKEQHLEFLSKLDLRIKKAYMRAFEIPDSVLDESA